MELTAICRKYIILSENLNIVTKIQAIVIKYYFFGKNIFFNIFRFSKDCSINVRVGRGTFLNYNPRGNLQKYNSNSGGSCMI